MKISFRVFAALSLCVALGTSALAAPQDGKMNSKMGGPGAKRGGRMRGMERIAQELGLTNAQQTKINAMMQAQRPQMQALFANKSLTQEQKMAKMKTISQGNMKRINAILTPVQRKKLAAMRQEQMAKRRGQM